jgi:hypothetical protein
LARRASYIAPDVAGALSAGLIATFLLIGHASADATSDGITPSLL